MRTLMKPDWAYKKAERYMRGYMDLKTEADLFDHLGAMLRAERRREVRVCRGSKWTNPAIVGGGYEYNQACDDCAKSIGGT